MESSGLHQLQQIPGLSKTIARDMKNIGIDDLKEEPIVTGSGINTRYDSPDTKGPQ